jgi:hypothetical protein
MPVSQSQSDNVAARPGRTADAAHEDSPAEPGVIEVIKRLIAAGRELAAAEMDWAKARGRFIAGLAIRIAIFGVVAGVLFLATIVALLVGAVLILSPLLGPGYALLAVIGGALVIIALCGLGIAHAVGRMKGAD